MLELKMYFLEKFLRYDKCRNNYGATLVTIENEEEMNYVQIVLKSGTYWSKDRPWRDCSMSI